MTCAVLALVLLLASSARPQSTEAIAELLEGVKDIAAPGTPSPLCVWSREAWPVLIGNAGDRLRAPAVVAGRIGTGRFVALPHNGYFAAAVLDTGETGRFLVNATKWAAGPQKKKPKVAARGEDLVALLNQSGCDAHALGPATLADELKSVDVICGLSTELTPADFEPLEKFLKEGGGVIAAQCAWGWLQVTGAPSLEGNPLNRFFARFGVAWSDGYLGKVGEVGFTAERAPPKVLHGMSAIEFLVTATHEGPNPDLERPMIQATATAVAIARLLPLDDRLVRPRLDQWLAANGATLLPSPASPLEPTDGFHRAMLVLALHDAELRPAEKVVALPCAKLFPGETPVAAPAVARNVAIDTTIPRWHSTGLYAAPGGVITVRLPESGGAAAAGLVLQIGAHTDELFDVARWERAPKIVRRVALDRAQVVAASPFGGPIYVVVPDDCALGTLEVRIERALEAPHFVLGRDSNETWRTALRHRSAPWAELESGKIIVTVPSSTIRDLDDPESLLRTWDRVADAAADLVALPRARRSPERFVADVQIAAGYMHSGYPIMTHLDAAAVMAGPEKLAQGDWGLFHELGHNHQVDDWTFEGTGEVTNNVICLFMLETVCGRTPASGGELFAGVAEGAQRMRAYFAGGASFEEWKKEPFLALQPYIQVQQAFGWEVYRKVFSEYRGLPRREKPKTDDAKRDLWLVMLSHACHRNLGPFFTAWGIPTSDTARAAVAELGEWMPEGFPPK